MDEQGAPEQTQTQKESLKSMETMRQTLRNTERLSKQTDGMTL